MNILSKIVAIKKQEITQKKKVSCLDENKSSEKLIAEAWESQLETPVSSDDEYLVKFIEFVFL